MSVKQGFVRTSILVPEDFWNELEELAGARKRSLFILAAARHELRRAKQRRVIRKATGAWAKAGPPKGAVVLREHQLRAVLEGDAEVARELESGVLEGHDLYVDALTVLRLAWQADDERREEALRLLRALQCVPITRELAEAAAELCRQGLSETEAVSQAAEEAMGAVRPGPKSPPSREVRGDA